MTAIQQTLARSAFKIGSGFLAALAITDDSTLELISAGIIAAVSVLWGVIQRTPPAGHQAAVYFKPPPDEKKDGDHR